MASRPIVDKNLIEQIKQKYLERNQKRDLLLFLLPINTGIKLIELLKLQVCDIKNKDILTIKESYTKIKKVFPLNSEIKELAKEYTENRKANEPLFISIFGKAVDRIQVFRNFKEIRTELQALVNEMVDSDLELAKKEKTLREHGYEVLVPQEV